MTAWTLEHHDRVALLTGGLDGYFIAHADLGGLSGAP